MLLDCQVSLRQGDFWSFGVKKKLVFYKKKKLIFNKNETDNTSQMTSHRLSNHRCCRRFTTPPMTIHSTICSVSSEKSIKESASQNPASVRRRQFGGAHCTSHHRQSQGKARRYGQKFFDCPLGDWLSESWWTVAGHAWLSANNNSYNNNYNTILGRIWNSASESAKIRRLLVFEAARTTV